MKTKLTIEQSQRLIELGIDANKASETTIRDEPCRDYIPVFPIFTLTDLLGILPKEIRFDFVSYNLTIVIEPHKALATYLLYNSTDVFYAPELIDALYELTIWLIENKFLQP